jgi:hypothetical protein
MDMIYREAHGILSNLVGQRRAEDLTEAEQLELLETAVSLIRRQRGKL